MTALDTLDPSALRPFTVKAFTMQTTTRSARVSSRACCPVAKTRLRVRAAVTNGSDNGGDGGAFSRISTMHRLIKNAGGTILVPGGASDPSETFPPRTQSSGQHSTACPFALQDAMSNAFLRAHGVRRLLRCAQRPVHVQERIQGGVCIRLRGACPCQRSALSCNLPHARTDGPCRRIRCLMGRLSEHLFQCLGSPSLQFT